MGDSSGNVSVFNRRHISESLAREFFAQSATKECKRFVVRHLLKGCKQCSQRMYRIGVELDLLDVKDQAWFEILKMQSPEIGTRRVLGLAQCAFLNTVAIPDRVQFINEHRAYQHLGLFERLVELSKVEARQDPLKAAQMADQAIAVARRLRMPEELRNDYVATATAVYGNAVRLAADFAGAEGAFRAAWRLREQGTADPLVDALIYRYEGAYYSDLGKYLEAEECLDKALVEYGFAGDKHLQGRTLVSMAAIASYHDPFKAMGFLIRAEALFDPAAEPILVWCIRHIYIWSMNEIGNSTVALESLEEARDLYNQFGRTDPWVRLRGYWLEARIAFNLKHFTEAESIFTMLFEDLDREGKHPVDLTLVAVDLLQTIAVQENRQADVIAFSDELLPLLRNLGLHDQGRAVLLMLRNALQTRTLDALGWERIKTYFRSNWHAPLPEPPTLD